MNELQRQKQIAELEARIKALESDKEETEKLISTIQRDKADIEQLIKELKDKLVTLVHELPF